MRLEPTGDRLIVRTLEAATKSEGGLYIPDVAQEKPQEGEVLAVGPGRVSEDGSRRVPVCVEEGDRILFGKYAGTSAVVRGREVLVLREDDIMAIIRDDGDAELPDDAERVSHAASERPWEGAPPEDGSRPVAPRRYRD